MELLLILCRMTHPEFFGPGETKFVQKTPTKLESLYGHIIYLHVPCTLKRVCVCLCVYDRQANSLTHILAKLTVMWGKLESNRELNIYMHLAATTLIPPVIQHLPRYSIVRNGKIYDLPKWLADFDV